MIFKTSDLQKIVNKFGRVLTIEGGTSTYNPATGTVTSSADTPVQIKGYVYNYQSEEIDGSSIQQGDRRVLFGPKDTDGDLISKPQEGSTITGVGDEVSIVRVDEILVGPQTACYICQVRE